MCPDESMTEQFAAQEEQRARDMRNIRAENPDLARQDEARAAAMQEHQAAIRATALEDGPQLYGLYTYQSVNGSTVCHLYGPDADQVKLNNSGQDLHQQAASATPPSDLGFMVLPCEPVPAPMEATS